MEIAPQQGEIQVVGTPDALRAFAAVFRRDAARLRQTGSHWASVASASARLSDGAADDFKAGRIERALLGAGEVIDVAATAEIPCLKRP